MQKNIKIVLVQPIYGGNIGSACRAMANMGVSELAVVAPQNPDWREAEVMAVHAGDILGSRKTYDTLADAIADCIAVVGTTARRGLYRSHAKAPREIAGELAQISDQGKVALVFGREDKGLLNEEVAMCTHIAQIPSSDEYASLNLSQAVMVMCYEMFIAQGDYLPAREKSGPAPARAKQRMMEMWREMLLGVGFMGEDKADHMMAGVQRIFSRGAFTDDDVSIMMGIAHQTGWAIRNPGAAPLNRAPGRPGKQGEGGAK